VAAYYSDANQMVDLVNGKIAHAAFFTIDDDARSIFRSPVFPAFRSRCWSALRPAGPELAAPKTFDAAILDVMLRDGRQAVPHHPQENVSNPYSARRCDAPGGKAWSSGASDYLPKPFEPGWWRAFRNAAALNTPPFRPPTAARRPRLVFDGTVVDPVRPHRKALKMSRSISRGLQFELFRAAFALKPGRVHSRDDILNQLRGTGSRGAAARSSAVAVPAKKLAGLHQEPCAAPTALALRRAMKHAGPEVQIPTNTATRKVVSDTPGRSVRFPQHCCAKVVSGCRAAPQSDPPGTAAHQASGTSIEALRLVVLFFLLLATAMIPFVGGAQRQTRLAGLPARC
jgi:OmpR family response regulator RpaB